MRQMVNNSDGPFRYLLDLVRRADPNDVPEHLRFWLESHRTKTGAFVWATCPRADWMLWIARQMKISQSSIDRAERFAAARVEEARQKAVDKVAEVFTPKSIAADTVREKIEWGQIADEFARASPTEHATRY